MEVILFIGLIWWLFEDDGKKRTRKPKRRKYRKPTYWKGPEYREWDQWWKDNPSSKCWN
ncbi:MAG: hypothetical protein LIO91_06095 [Bacteroidales bacterium]|nr:hypothetical protein [Bacteroidales bacterium]